MIEPDDRIVDTAYVNGSFFNVDGVEFTLHLRYEGPLPEVGKDLTDEVFRYAIARAHSKTPLETGKLRWNPINGPLTYREAQKSLITYWRTKTTSIELNELDRIVEKCAFWMHTYFLSDHEENTDYDIVRQFMDEDEWVVVLRPNYMPKRLVEFYKKIDREDIQINSYIEIDELSVKF